jgi:Eukaryotic aspartyl protease
MASKIKVILNPKYQRNGTKSYVHALRKFGFDTTLEGPYFHVNRVRQRGKFTTAEKKPIGGRVRIERVLQKKVGTQTGDVPAEDIQNDTEYLAKVEIGTPAQTLSLDFDSGSSDLWVSILSCISMVSNR